MKMFMNNVDPDEAMSRKERRQEKKANRVLDKDARKRLKHQKKMSNLSFENGGPMRDTLLNKIARNK